MVNPYDFTGPVRDPAMFFGRTKLRQEILDGVRRGESFAVTGNKGIGKSSLLLQLRLTLLAQLKTSGNSAIVPVLVRKRDFPSPTPSIICQRIVDQFRTVLAPSDAGEDWRRGVRLFDSQIGDHQVVGAFREALDTIGRTRHVDCRIVLMLDDVDRLSQYRWSHAFFDELRQLTKTTSGVRMTAVVADFIAPPSNEVTRTPLLNVVNEVKTLGVLSQSETEELVTRPIGLEHASPIVSSIVNETGGHPFLVQYLMNRLVDVRDGHLPRTTEQEISSIITRYFDERSDFRSWVARFSDADHRAYHRIASGPGTTRADLLRELGDSNQASRAIQVLLQTGVVREEPPDSGRYRTSGEMFRRWFYDTRQATASTDHEPVVLRSPQATRRPFDEIQFTVYRPNVLLPGEWKTMLAFMHLASRRPDAPPDEPSPVEQVQGLARQALGRQASSFGHITADARSSVPRESEITLVPDVPGLEFRPDRRTFLWIDDVHQEQFTVRAHGEANGTIARGRLSAFLGVILLAEVDISIRVDSAHPAGEHDAPKESSTAKLYRRVFASYSRKDTEIVRQFELFVQALGDVYLRDVHDIKPGMDWRIRLRELIQEADVFQLFWSHNAMRSAHVRAEWEYALSLKRPGFVRPTYWEDPLPESPADGLPPESLRRLHFHRLGWSPSPDPAGETVLAGEAMLTKQVHEVASFSKDALSSDAGKETAAALEAAHRKLEETLAQRELEEARRSQESRDAERRQMEDEPSVDDVLATVVLRPPPGAAAPAPVPLPEPQRRPQSAPASRSNRVFILVAVALLALLGLALVFLVLD